MIKNIKKVIPILSIYLFWGISFFGSSIAYSGLKVVATIPTLASIAEEVGGEFVSVDVMSSSKEDPHYVDARPDLIIKLNKADLLILNGLDLEIGWLPSIQQNARNPKIIKGGIGYFDASSYVKILDIATSKTDRSQGDIHSSGNPHYLFDPRAGERVVVSLAEKFALLDPVHANIYRERAKKLSSLLLAFASEQSKLFLALKPNLRNVVSYHKSLVYLYSWLSLNEVITVESKPGSPPDPGHVAKVLSVMKKDGLRVIIQEAFYPDKTTKTISNLVNGQVVKIEGGTDFVSHQKYIDYLAKIASTIYSSCSS